MSYIKQTWQAGDEITSAKLNHVEDGIGNLEQTTIPIIKDVTNLKSAIGSTELELWDNKLINTALTTKILPENATGNNGYKCIVISCAPGDIFQVSGMGGINPRLWAFADSEGTMIEQDITSSTRTNYQLTAPENAAYFAYNCRKEYSGTPKAYRNGTPDVRLKNVESAAVSNVLGYIKNASYDKPVFTRLKYINDYGIEASSNKYAGTALFVPGRNIAIGIENDLYVYQVAGYSANGDVLNGTGFISKTGPMYEPMIIPNNWEKIAVMVFRKDNTSIVSGTSETTTIRNALTFYTLVDPELTVPYVPADAKVTGDRLNAIEPMANAAFPSCLNIISINHRGYHVNAPENTIPAFIQSRKMGFDAVETDIRFTKDNVPVLIHNGILDGKCCLASDGSAITGNITVNSLDYDELLMYDACTPAQYATYGGTKIPTLREFMSLCRKIGLRSYIELKEGTTSEQVATCINVVKDCGMLNYVVWFSSQLDILGYVQAILPKATLAIYEDQTILDAGIEAATTLKTDDNEIIMWVTDSNNLANNIAKCKAAGLTFYLGTNNINTILSLDPYVSGVNSDSLHAGKILFNSIMNEE